MICLDHADVADTLGVEFLHRLVDQRQRRHGEEGPAAIIAIAPGNGRTDDCLAKSRRRLSYEVTLAGGYCAIDLVEQLDLMRAKGIAAMGEWCYLGFEPPAKPLEILAQVHRQRGGLGRSIFDHELRRGVRLGDFGPAVRDHAFDRRRR